MAHRIRRGVLFLQADIVSGVQKFLDESVASKWQIRWNENGKERATYEYVKCVAARERRLYRALRV